MKAIHRIKEFIDKKGLTIASFERAVGFSNGAFSSQLKKGRSIGVDKLENILSTYSELNPLWVLKGEGQMILEGDRVNEPKENYADNNLSKNGIPLIPTDAFAGIGGQDVSIRDIDVKERYIVPEFTTADFMIKVKGSSMYPKYSSGDVVACKIIRSSTFLQWGKAHVIHTIEQGSLVKRLFSTDDESTIECRSDNQDYPPFIVKREEITTIALIIGVIRLE